MAQWPAWLVPPAGGTGQGVAMSRNRPGVSVGSADALPALPPCDPVGVSGDVDLAVSAVVVKPRATTRIAPLHDLSPGSGETWLVGRWVRWSVDRLNALDRKTARTIPALEKEASDAKRRVKRAVQRELTNQFPPLQVYLADRAFALDEARNADAEERARDARAEANAAEPRPNDAKEPNDEARVSEASGTADAETASSSAVVATLCSKHGRTDDTKEKKEKETPEERPARRKLTDFFVASGGSAPEPASAESAAVEPASAARPAPPPPTTEEVARAISRASETCSKQTRPETKAEREARWAREGAALAASLAATSRPETPKKSAKRETPNSARGNPGGTRFFPTDPHPSRIRSSGPRVSRSRTEARAAPVASAPRLALAPPKSASPDPPTRLAAPRLAPMEKPRAAQARVSRARSTPTDPRLHDRNDAARRERRARRAHARQTPDARSDGAPGESLSSVLEDASGFFTKKNANPEGGFQPRRARSVSRETELVVDRMMARSVAPVASAGALPDDGTPSKHRRRAFGDETGANGATDKSAAAATRASLSAKMDRLASSLAAAAASAAGALSELAEQAYDGGGEFAADADKENKIRTESVVTVSVDGSDVMVHTRRVAVRGKQI